MTFPYHHWLAILLLISLSPIRNSLAQVKDSAFIPFDSVHSRGFLISHKDTIVNNGDTSVVRKEVWIREKSYPVWRLDSIVSGGMVRYYGRTERNVRKDTIVVIQDTILTRNQRVIRQLMEISSRNTWWSKLLNKILVFPDPKPANALPSQQSSVAYDPYEGKIIRNINIRVLNVFGYSIHNLDKRPHSFLEKSGNFVHIKTQRWIVRNRLLFSAGDTINSLKVSESERLLRANNFIYDARIIVRDTSKSDSVDVDVIVQDVWSISGGVSGGTYYGGTLKDVNFLGLGQQILGDLKLSPNLPGGHNFVGSYVVNNISKTFLTGNIYYSYLQGQTYYGGGVNREFISPAIKWAGGVNVAWNAPLYYLFNSRDTIVSVQRARYIQNDIWLGYGLDISPRDGSFKGSRLIFSGRVLRSKYYETPVLPDTVVPLYYQNTLYLGSIGIFGRRFYKDRYIFRLGRTEDIPEAYLLSFTYGYQKRATDVRPYYGMDAAFSRYYSWGYLFGAASLGGYYQQRQWREAGLSGRFLYFTPLIKFGKWRYRHFIGFRYTRLYNFNTGIFLNINQEQGLRGFNTGLVKGTSRFVFNCEMNLMPPLNLVGFHAVLILFADLGWIARNATLWSKDNFFPGYGLGIRFRNDHLVFSTVQLMLGYYPHNLALGLQEYRVYERNNLYYNYYNLQFNRPSTFQY